MSIFASERGFDQESGIRSQESGALGWAAHWLLAASRQFRTIGFWLLASAFWLLTSDSWLLVSAAQATPDLTTYLDHPVARVVILYGGAPLTGEEVALADLIGIRAGDLLRMPAVHDAIVRLYESGSASNVVVTAQGPPTAMTLTFDITPQPVVSQVVFEGVAPELTDDLRRRLPPMDPGTRVTQGLLNRAAEQIVEYYHHLGYFDVRVTPDVSLAEGGRRATVIFRVTPGERATVEQIQFEGALKLDRHEALSQFQLKPGTPYSAFVLQEDLQRLRRLHIERGYRAPRIGTPRTQRDYERNTVTIAIPVDSGPLVELQVEGVSLSEKEKRGIFPTLEVGGIDEATLEEGRLKLLDFLQRQGHFFAEVEFERPQHTDDKVVIVYTVDPGRKYDLEEIRIEGTDAVTYDDVKNDLGSKPGGLFGRGLTSRELMDADQRVITNFLRDRGYLSARVAESRLSVAVNREDLIIIYVVEPGPLSSIAEIDFRGNQAISDAELRGQIQLTEGQALSQPSVNENVARLATFYSSQGYAESFVNARIEYIQQGEPDVRVIFNITEGNQLRIHRILIRGNTLTTEQAVRKFLTFREGELLVNERLSESEQALYSSGAFRRVVIDKEPAGVGPEFVNQRNVVVELVETPRYLLVYGGGYRTDDGPRGLFEITDINLFGRLNTGSIRTRASRRELLGQLSFTNPRPFGHNWPALFSALYQREDRDAFDASRLTGLIQFEREFIGGSFLILRYTYSNVIISDITDPERLRREDTTTRIGRISGSFLRDRRDSAFEPTRGDYTSVDLSLASRALGGEDHFLRFFGEHQRYYRLPGLRSTVFAADARLGLAKPFGRTDTIAISERFFAGGSTTLRGFGFEQAGPRGPDPDPDRQGQTKPLGGNALVILNAELRFPIWERLRIGGALFYDTGNVFARISDIELRKFGHTVGFGLRIRTPIGPVRVDFGVLVKEEPLVPRTRLHISFGPPF
ncbi:MAG: BamA/TamA family outer membrane protein [Acidobacteria bacterium]|nr:BamA/TamA family outer membrane protein [Acidobacteriota bacterium]